MIYNFNGVCKKCGSVIDFSFDIDRSDYYHIHVRCPSCGTEVISTDLARIFQIAEIIEKYAPRTEVFSISSVSAHPAPRKEARSPQDILYEEWLLQEDQSLL